MNPDYMDEREVVTTKERVDKLEGDFLKNLQVKTGNKYLKKNSSVSSSVAPQEKSVSIVNDGTEEFLMDLYDVRDNLIESFASVELGSALSNNLSKQINNLGKCIAKIGGQVESFDPLKHVSGLKLPNGLKNAERVIETTRQCYSLGEIKDSSVNDDGSKIVITFNGINKAIKYSAKGSIEAKNGKWIGNEAIDYIHTPCEGKMSVKVYDGGKWEDKSSDYVISWELMEEDVKKELAAEDQKNIKKTEVKEELVSKLQNNLDEINDDFTIEEK